MPEKTIHLIGYDEMVYLFGLMGIPGTVLEDPKLFKDKFNKIRKDPSVSMIILSMDLPDNLIDFISEFKLNNRTPFVYYMPEIFQRNIEQSSAVLDKLLKSIQKILR